MSSGPAILLIPDLQLGRGLNDREHPFVRRKRVQRERWRVVHAWRLAGFRPPPGPWHVALTRCTPSGGTDFVNMVGSLKAIQDQVAEELSLRDDREAKGSEADRATWSFHEETKVPWGVRIEIATRADAQRVG